MADLQLVQVLDAGENLLQEASGLLLPDPLVGNNMVEELAATRILHNQEELFFGLNNLVELNDDWVSEYLENVDFAADSLRVARIHYLVLL
jgi:hypothetical protein